MLESIFLYTHILFLSNYSLRIYMITETEQGQDYGDQFDRVPRNHNFDISSGRVILGQTILSREILFTVLPSTYTLSRIIYRNKVFVQVLLQATFRNCSFEKHLSKIRIKKAFF